MSSTLRRFRRAFTPWVASLAGLSGGFALLQAAPIAEESLSYNALTDGATLGAASADWIDDGGLGGHELLVTNSGAGTSLAANVTFDHTDGNSTASAGARRSTWNLQGNTLSLQAGPHYISFLARTDGADSFRFELGNGTYNRWMPFKVNNDGSVETGIQNLDASNAVSASGLWQANTTYLVVAKFDSTGGDKSLMSLYNLSDPTADYQAEPASDGDWLLNAGFASGVTLDQLTITASQAGVAFDEIRIGSSYADVIPLSAARNLGDTVEYEWTGQPRSREHLIREAGDYQIGIAWAEVDSGDDVALEVFKNGSERVKALNAPAGEVTRFETRIEGLEVGDTLTVKITPNGGTYRAGYQLACSTPIFDGLPTFDVHDVAYGAVGDGVTDDFAAIQAAVNAAKAAGGGIVQFDGAKTYRAVGLNDLTVEALIDLEDAANIKIEGNGATVVLHPPDRFAYVYYAENIQIDGFTIDYDPIPYYQGTITNIDVANLTIDIDVPTRYPEPAVGVVTNPGGSYAGRGPFFGRSFIPDSVGARSGRGENIYVESTAQIGGDPRKIRIQVPTTANGVSMLSRVQDAYNNNATEFVVPDYNYGHRSNGSTQIYGSSRVKLSNLSYHSMAYFWLKITQNDGPVTLSNVDLEVSDPATELLASWRDGMHIKNGRWGILIEEGDWDGAAMYDDTFAIYSRRQVVISTAADVATLTPGFGGLETWLWQPGDWASFWSPNQDVLRGMARVISVTDIDSSSYEVTFEAIPSGVLANDIVLHEESLNRGTLVRNSRTTSVGTEYASTRLRGTDMRFENNHFEDFSFKLEFSDSLATPRARDVVVQDTYISSPDGSLVLSRPLGVLFKDCEIDGLDPKVYSGADDVYFDNVAWTNMTGDMLDILNSSHAWLFGGSSRNGSTSGLSSHVSVDGSSSITYATPANYPAASPTLSTGFTPPAAPTLTSVAGEGRVTLDWSDSAGAEQYTVYRGPAASGPFAPVLDTVPSSHIDTGLTPRQTFFYVITAMDSAGNESSFSNVASAQPTGSILAVQADAYVNGGISANGNYGSSVELRCKTDATLDFTRESYLRFDLSSLTGSVGSAVLRLKAASVSGNSDVYTAYAVADDSWTESTLNWNNKPAAGTAIASATTPEVDTWTELDVTAQVASELAADQSFSTVLISSGSELVTYHSKEALSADDHPELVVTMLNGSAPTAPTGLTIEADGSGTVNLSWDDQSGAGVVLYRLYRSTDLNGPYTQVIDTDATSYTDSSVASGHTTYYRLVAIDADSNASVASSSVRMVATAYEGFDYFDTTQLSSGSASGGSGWADAWEALSGGGLEILNGRIDQTTVAGSTRELSTPFILDEPGDIYFSFFARADASGAFSFNLKQSSPDYVRWAFARNADGSVTIQGGTATATSAAGVFAADKEYLVVSKFETTGDIAYLTLIDPENPGDYTTEPLIWDLSADGDSGVTIDRLDVEVSAGNVQLDDIAIGASYADVIGALSTEVPVALSPLDTASSPYAFPNFSWTEHRLQFQEMDAPVNYEIEIATDAAFTNIVDSDRIGLARYVHDHPFAEGNYYWRVRSVTDGGRLSDWSTVRSFTVAAHDEVVTVNYDLLDSDHGAAVLTAVDQVAAFAAQGKSVKLVFPAGNYYFNDSSMDTLIELDGVNQVSIEGAGAHLHFTSRKQSLMSSEGSTEVSVSGLEISYAVGALRIQGTVTAVDSANSIVTLAIEPGYPDFSESDSYTNDIFLLLDPVIDGRQKTDSVSYYNMVSNGYSQNQDGTWDVILDRASTPEWEIGDRFVYHFRSGSPVFTRFDESNAVTLYGLEIGGYASMMIASIEGSLVNVLNVNTYVPEGRWMMGNADGIHIRSHAVGPWVEGTHIQANGDDGIALYARPASMSSAKPGGVQNAAVFVDSYFNLEAGDEVSFFESQTGTILLETYVNSVVDQGDGTWLTHFDNDLPEGMSFSGALVDITQVWNRSKSCGDFMIRNGAMTNNRRYAIVQRARRGIIENMEVRGASSRSIHFVNETAYPNGLYTSEIIIRNNLIEDSGFVAGWVTPLTFSFTAQGTNAASIGPRNLLIENNIFASCGTPEIGMNDTRNVVIRNNRTTSGGGIFVDATYSATDSERIVAYMDDYSGDSTAPAAPLQVEAVPSAVAVALDWSREGDSDVVTYSVYRSTVSGSGYALLAEDLLTSYYEDASTVAGTTYYYVVRATDIAGNESVSSAEASAAEQETDAPTPNAATFAVLPAHNDGAQISMTATSGSDASGPVEYYFTETSGNAGGSDSGWQSSSVYVDDGLSFGTEYSYTVTMRDALLNAGNASVPQSATTPQLNSTYTVNPVADTYVHGGSNANTNYGNNVSMACKMDVANEQNTRHAYLRYDLSSISGQIGRATLRVKVASANGSDDVHTAYAVADDAWGETSLTWNNQPTVGAALSAAKHPDVGGWIELDVTDQVKTEYGGDQTFSTALISGGTVLVTYHSREASVGDQPELVVETIREQLSVEGDAHVLSLYPNTNYGSSAALECKTSGSYTRHAYLRYDLSTVSAPVSSAVLRVKVASITGSGSNTHTAYAVADDTWSEGSLTWNNKPAAGSALDSATYPAVGDWIELDVTDQLEAERTGDQVFSTVLISDGDVLVNYHSSEAAATEDKPQLLLFIAYDAPVANPQSVSVNEDGSLAITLSGSDPNNDPLTYAVTAQPANGGLSGTAPNLTYTPDADFNGADSFSFTVNDGTEDSAEATVSITVNAQNDAPLANGQAVALNENDSLAISLSGSDADNDPLTYVVTAQPANGSLSGTAPNLTYTPDTDFNGADSFSFTVNDGTVDSPAAVVAITVHEQNNDPAFSADPIVADNGLENSAYVGSLSATDIDGDSLSYSKVSGPDWLSVASDGSLSGTPLSADIGANSWTVQVSDGNGGSDQATLNITVDADPNPAIRVTEYYLSTGDFTGTSATLTLDQDLADDYYILVRGSRDGNGTSNPNNDYARISAVPGGQGDLPDSGASDQLTLQRQDASNNWEGVVTVIECGNSASDSGFKLVDALVTNMTTTSGTVSTTAWSDINQVVLFGGYRGGGIEMFGTPTNRKQGTGCYTRLYPSGSNTLNWTRDAGGETMFDATMTTFVVEWGSDWTVQHVNVVGSNGGNGADATSEYTTAAINSVNRDNTWVWATGTRVDSGIGDCAEACLVTLGDGVTQNVSESTVAVGSEYSDAYDFDVYVMTHSGLSVDHRFKVDGDSTSVDLAQAVDTASAGTRFGWVTNGCNGTGAAFARPRMWARYTDDGEITISRGYSGQNFPAWIQGIDFSGVNGQ